jgi:hypothetical protein
MCVSEKAPCLGIYMVPSFVIISYSISHILYILFLSQMDFFYSEYFGYSVYELAWFATFGIRAKFDPNYRPLATRPLVKFRCHWPFSRIEFR